MYFTFLYYGKKKEIDDHGTLFVFATINVSRDLTPVVFPIVALRFLFFTLVAARFLPIDDYYVSFQTLAPAFVNRPSASARNDLENGSATRVGSVLGILSFSENN